jgi:hypothetical protein
MKEEKNIDRLFQEKFKDFNATPSANVWANIEKELKEDKERTPFIIPLWYKIGGIAAALALLFWFTQPLLTTDENNTIVEQDAIKNPTEKTQTEDKDAFSNNNSKLEVVENTSKTSELETSSTNDIVSSSGQESSKENSSNKNTYTPSVSLKESLSNVKGDIRVANKSTITQKQSDNIEPLDKQLNSNENNKFQQPNLTQNTTAVTSDDSSTNSNVLSEKENKETTEVAETNLPSLLEEAEKQKQTEAEDEQITAPAISKKWNASPYVAPIYASGFGSGNTIDPQFSDNETSSDVTLAYGVNVSYAVNDRLKIRSGVTKMTHSTNTNNIAFSPSGRETSLQNLKANANSGVYVQVGDSEALIQNSPSTFTEDQLVANRTAVFLGDLNQQLGFIEVPLELEYALINNRFGVNLICGASTLFLENNSIAVVNNGNRNEIGEATNVNNVSFSTNLGLGVNYKITSSLQFNVEPTFKYQINTFSNSSNFNPYYLGVYSGFSFKF